MPQFTDLVDPTSASAALRPGAVSGALIRDLAAFAVFGEEPERRAARSAVRSLGEAQGAFPASIAGLYGERGRGRLPDFTVPAINIRGMTFDVASACFRAMVRAGAAAVIFEINRAEIGFTDQQPDEFASVVLAAAVAEGWRGPVFIQLDHLMADAAAYGANPERERGELEAVIRAAVGAGLFNIDIDASTLVDLSFPAVEDQQRPNIELTAHLARFVRSLEPPAVRISLGGEIGEVGGKNSTPQELIAFVEGFLSEAGDSVPGGLAKVSVQTGTKHGGIRLPDGTIASVALDFETLAALSRICRERYGMAGAVQHGASTLPEALFARFVDSGCAEVHLATGFQDLVLDHPAFPRDLRAEMEAWTLRERAVERTPGETDAQFTRRVRRKAWGPYKRPCWEVGATARAAIMRDLEERFLRLFDALAVAGTLEVVTRFAPGPGLGPAPSEAT